MILNGFVKELLLPFAEEALGFQIWKFQVHILRFNQSSTAAARAEP